MLRPGRINQVVGARLPRPLSALCLFALPLPPHPNSPAPLFLFFSFFFPDSACLSALGPTSVSLFWRCARTCTAAVNQREGGIGRRPRLFQLVLGGVGAGSIALLAPRSQCELHSRHTSPNLLPVGKLPPLYLSSGWHKLHILARELSLLRRRMKSLTSLRRQLFIFQTNPKLNAFEITINL